MMVAQDQATQIVAGHEVELDDNGIPQMPESLRQYAEMLLVTRYNGKKYDKSKSNEFAEFDAIVNEVYDMWEANDFRTVQVVPRSNMELTPCREASSVTFDADFPVREDYFSDHSYEVAVASYWIEVAAAKEVCSSCPLRAQCLANSITMYATKNGKTNNFAITYAETGIWGAWGPAVRADLHEEINRRWAAHENAFSPEAWAELREEMAAA